MIKKEKEKILKKLREIERECYESFPQLAKKIRKLVIEEVKEC